MTGKCSKSAVLKYFIEVEGTQELICQVKNKDGSIAMSERVPRPQI